MDFKFIAKDTADGTVEVFNRNDYERKTIILSADEAIEKLMIKTTRTTGVLPPVVRYISATGRFILLERPPQIMSFNYYGKMQNDIEKAQLQEFDLPLPWTQYAIGLDHLNRPYMTYVFATPHAIQGVKDVLYVLPVPNCEINGKFCTPYPEWNQNQDKPWSISEGINTAYAAIWNSNFNTDIISNILNAYRLRQPSSIFAGKGKRGEMSHDKAPKPSNLFKRWEEFDLKDVSQWNDWVPIQSPDGTFRVEGAILLLNQAEQEFNATYLYNTLRQRTMA